MNVTPTSGPAAGNRRHSPNGSARSPMRIVRLQPGLACRVRRADGRVVTARLPPARHRAIQLGLLHADSGGFVELTPGTRRADGTLAVDRRRRPEHYLPGGGCGDPCWVERLRGHAARIGGVRYTPPPVPVPPARA